MDFKLSAVQEKQRQLAREFAQKEIEPIAPEVDRTDTYPIEVWEKMRKSGLVGVQYPKRYGGLERDFLSYILTLEELSRASAAVGYPLLQNGDLVAGLIMRFANEQQKDRYLPPLVTGEKFGLFMVTEHGSGSDSPRAIKTRAVPDGDHWVITGSKHFVSTIFDPTGAAIIFARIGEKNVGCFLAETTTSGFVKGKKERMAGLKGTEHREYQFENLRLPKGNLLGGEDDGTKILYFTIASSRIAVAAQALGLAQAALDEAAKRAREHERFSRKIGAFQAIQWMITDMAVGTETARLLTYKAAIVKEQGGPFHTEASMAKLWATEVAVDAARKASQIYGGYGCMEGTKVERLYRDAKLLQVYEGTSEVQKHLVAKSLLGPIVTLD